MKPNHLDKPHGLKVLIVAMIIALPIGGLLFTNLKGSVGDQSENEQDKHLMTGGVEMNNAWFTEKSTVGDVIREPAFEDFGRLLFPVDRAVSNNQTLEQISSSSVYLWYSHIRPATTVAVINFLLAQVRAGQQIFYDIYSPAQKAADPSKRNTGIFFFKGEPAKEFALLAAGGGFYYVGAMHDSMPHAMELARNGYNAFALIYRPERPYADMAQAISFIHDNANQMEVNPSNYSLWGGSAGARMAATLGNSNQLRRQTGRDDIEPAAAVITQYTGYFETSYEDAPTYACVGTQDYIANWKTMQTRLKVLSNMGIPTEFHSYNGLGHGFGLGEGTIAQGWIQDAIAFWQAQIK